MKYQFQVIKNSLLSFLVVGIFVLAFLFTNLPIAKALTSGPNNPSTGADDSSVGTITWSTPANIFSSNNGYSTASLNDNQISHYLKATNFGFAIPAGATINGISIDIEKKSATASRIKDYRVRIIKGGSIGATDKSDSGWWSTTDSYISYGGIADLWGETWTYSDINNSTFGVAISATKASTAGAGVVASIDHIRITVTYTVGNAPNSPVLVSPVDGTYTNDSTPTLSANYSDSDMGDTGTTSYRVATSAANCLSGTVVASGTSIETLSNNQNTTWTPGSPIGGSATYYWCAQNNDGVLTSAWTSMGNFILDITNPTSTISSPLDNSYSTSTTVALSGTSSDTNLSTTTISVDGQAFVPTNGTAALWTYSAMSLSQGAHTFQTKATDLVGNTGLSLIVNVTVDSIAPIISINNPTTSPAQSKTITASTNEGVLTQSITTGVLCDNTLTFTAYSLTTFNSEADNGKKVCYRAIDTATNTTYSMSDAISGIDTTAPIISFTDNVELGPVVTDTITADWGDASIKKWDYDNDGICSVNSGDYSKTDADSINQNTETNNGKYICIFGEDLAGNKVSLASSNFINIDATAPIVNTVAVQTGLTVNIVFSETMGSGITNPSNYIVSGTGMGTLSANPDNVSLVSGNTYLLAWTSGLMISGGDITITVSSVQDVAGNTIGSPNSATHVAGAIGLDHFTFNTISGQTAGISFPITITAKDANNNTVTNYTGTVDLTTSALTINPTTSNMFVSGVLTQSVILNGSGASVTITATDNGGIKTGISNSFNLTAAATKFVILPPTNGTVEGPVTVTIQAQKSDNSKDLDYQNDVTLNATGSALVAGSGLVNIVNGEGTINVTDTTAETITLSLTDSESTGLNVDSTQQLTFVAGPVTQFILNDPGDMYARTRKGYTVARKDTYGNSVTSGLTTVNLSTTSVSLAAKFYDDSVSGSEITSIDIVDGNSLASFWYYDEEPGTYTITAAATDITSGVDSIIVMPVAVKFVILPATGITVDSPATITVQAQKPDDSKDTNYQNDVTLNATGSALVAGSGLVNIVNGEGTINVTDTTAETITLSLTDSESTGLNVDSTQQIIFYGGVAAQFVLSHPEPLSAGSRVQYTVSRQDQYNNLTTTGSTLVYLFSSSLGSNKKFYDAATEGSIIFSITIPDGQSSVDFWYYDEVPGNYSITVSDNSPADGNININDAIDSLSVIAGPVTQFSLDNPGDVFVGTRLKYTATRKDQFNNNVANLNTTAYLYSSSLSGYFYDSATNGNIITSLVISDGQSSVDFWYYDETPGTYNITISDSFPLADGVNGIVDATDEVILSAVPIVATKFIIVDPTDGTVDSPITVTVRAEDDSGNLDTTYQNDVTLVADGSAIGDGIVDIIDGVGTINISNTVVQTVNLSLVDSEETGLNVGSTQNVIFSIGEVNQFSINNPGDMSAGSRIGYSVTRKDQYGNLILTGTTKVYLYGLPTTIDKKFYDSEIGGSVITFINIIDGQSSANFWYYDETAGTASVVVSDNASAPDGVSGISDISDTIIVSAGPVSKFILDNPGDMMVNTRLGYNVSRQDQFGNLVTTGTTIVYPYSSSTGLNDRFYDSAIGGLIVTSIVIDDGNSSANFWYYDEAAGVWVITVSDTYPVPDGSSGIDDDADSVTVSISPIVATRFVIQYPGNSSINVPITVTIRAEDNNGNVDTTYQEDVSLVASGSATGEGLINIINGEGTVQINNTVAETVLLSLLDSESTGLNVSSVVQITFSSLPPVFIGGAGASNIIVGAVTFSGTAYPGANLEIAAIKETENVIKKGTVVSGDGKFTITFTGLSAGSRAYALLVKDEDGRIAQSRVYDLNMLSADSVLSVNNILISPTLGFSRPTITKGDFLAITGYAAPLSNISVEVDGKIIDAKIVAGNSGMYKYLYNTAELDLGSHTVKAFQTTASGVQSEFSPQKVFFTTNLTVPKTDFNNDGNINVNDWSIFLTQWFSDNSSIKLRDDLNGDGKVDATDFSIFIRTLRQ